MPLLPLYDAAQALGVSPATLRKRLKAGTAQGERRPTRSGFAWWVEVAEVAEAAGGEGMPPGARVGNQEGAQGVATATQVDTHKGTQAAAHGVTTGHPPAAETAALREAVTRLEAHNVDLRERVNDQAREIAELHRLLANQQQLLLMAPKAEPQSVEAVTNGHAQTQNGAASEWPERRRWWQRVLWG
jgi:hypothetical protein